ncbi:MAG: BMC domain-containing protein [Desulfovibrio sp.]|nr:BMC domain-containing protein [Desulfovibrio sp.]MBI4960632.1 BMC domain-containing protein [Desulfovibrio sp.]
MRYYGEEALGLIETLGMVPAINGADRMLKAANVALIAYENVGSTLVAVMVKGDVAAVKAAVDAGAAGAAEIGKLTARNVMPRPIRGVGDIVSVHAVDDAHHQENGKHRPRALGLIEVFGIVFVLEAADAMLKTADVELVGYENVASGYISVLVQGDVAACTSAVEAGVKAVEEMGATVYSSVVIPSPHPSLASILKRYDLENLLPH